MGTDNREVGNGREDTIDGGVVLRFPGDWVGPLEELVPFGPSADRDRSPPASEPDFWGEGSAALQDAVEAPRLPSGRPLNIPRRLLAGGAVVAAALFALAGVLGGRVSGAPHVHGVTFAVASIPPLAPAMASDPVKRPSRHRSATRPRRHAQSTRRPADSTPATTASSPVTTPPPAYHPAASAASSSSSQSGGAFTLGGP